ARGPRGDLPPGRARRGVARHGAPPLRRGSRRLPRQDRAPRALHAADGLGRGLRPRAARAAGGRCRRPRGARLPAGRLLRVPGGRMSVTGVIQAGGRSTRMGGTPKALMDVGGRRIIDRVVEVVRGVTTDLLLVTNTPDLYADLGVRMVGDAYPD